MRRSCKPRVPSGAWIPIGAFSTMLLLAGCPDVRSPIEPEDEEPPAECAANEPNCEVVDAGNPAIPGLVVSESRAMPGTAVASAASDESGVAYVSATPGTLQGALSVRIRNVTAGALPLDEVSVIDGGFDPVIVPASPGDSIDLAVRQGDGTITHVTFVVPVRRPPVVVRTNPPKGRTDVALSIRPLVVFSEPIDPQSLGPTTVQLLGGGTPVPGTVAVVAGSSFMAEFIPDAPLEPLAGYELVVTTAVRDVQSDALEQEVRVGFTTGSGTAGLRVSNTTTGGAFDVDGYQVIVRQGGQPLLSAALELNRTLDLTSLPEGEVTVELADVADNCVVSGGVIRTVAVESTAADQLLTFDVACTPPPELASIRLIFSIWDNNNNDSDLWAMNADGTGLQQLTAGPDLDWGPLVSRDGTRIAFSRTLASVPPAWTWWGYQGPSAYVMEPDGSNVTAVAHFGGPRGWTPDGAILVGDGFFGPDGTRLGSFAVNYSNPVWSPDGSMVAFRWHVQRIAGGCDDPSGGDEIWVMNADRTNTRSLRRMVSCPAYHGALSWSADGRIVFEDRQFDEPSPLWSMRSDGSNVVQAFAPNRMFFGEWSPDRSFVILMPGPEGPRDIFLLQVADGTVWRVTATGLSTSASFLH